MATKFGRIFQKELKHYVLFRRKIERELSRAIKLLRIHRGKSPLDVQVMALADFMLEINQVVADCFKHGFLSSGLHQLRLAQEVAQKLLALHLKPPLAKRKKMTPGEVREVLEQGGIPHWRELYSELSKVTHHHSDFIHRVYPEIRTGAKATADNAVFIEFYLMILNDFNMKALFVILNQLKPHLGRDYGVLLAAYDELDPVAAADWETANANVEASFGVNSA
ncbi:MAG: hypothetical protein KAU35_09900 [candidate division Zixibacteria bacterium]|nr:hypothetical protein [candidate division Zixibacteria bacterium]